MADPAISEIKYLGNGDQDILEVRVPDDYPDPENLVLVIYDRFDNGSTTASPAANDIYNITTDGLLYTEDTNLDGDDDDGILHYTIGFSEEGTVIRLHAQDAVGLYNSVTGETYGLFNWSGSPYTVSTASGDPFAGQTATLLDNTGQIRDVTSLELQPDGTYTLSSNPDPGSSFICFASGTRILTPDGERPVETLAAGDEVLTKDNGAQTIRWIGQRTFSKLCADDAHLHPITIEPNAFGEGVPRRRTQLSPNHMLLIDDWRATMYFGEREVLSAAKALATSDVAYRANVGAVTYIHILLDAHNLILANGLWAESLFLGSECMGMLRPGARSEVFDMFPQVRSNLGGYGPKARHQLRAHEAALLI